MRYPKIFFPTPTTKHGLANFFHIIKDTHPSQYVAEAAESWIPAIENTKGGWMEPLSEVQLEMGVRIMEDMGAGVLVVDTMLASIKGVWRDTRHINRLVKIVDYAQDQLSPQSKEWKSNIDSIDILESKCHQIIDLLRERRKQYAAQGVVSGKVSLE